MSARASRAPPESAAEPAASATVSDFSPIYGVNSDIVRAGGVDGPRVRRHHARNVSGAGAGRSRDIVQRPSGPGARAMVPALVSVTLVKGRAAARATFWARS